MTTIPDLITASDTSNTDVTIIDNLRSEARDIVITVVSGTFKFNMAGDASDSGVTYTSADGSRVFTIDESRTFSYQAANASETFRIE